VANARSFNLGFVMSFYDLFKHHRQLHLRVLVAVDGTCDAKFSSAIAAVRVDRTAAK
jgi:hypothetical protein